MSEERQPTIGERCFDLNMRVERIVHLPAMVSVNIEDDLFEFLTEECEDLLAELLDFAGHDTTMEKFLNQYGSRRDARFESLQEVLVHRLQGWIVAGSQPVMTKLGSGASMSWGRYRIRPFYGDTYEEALEKVLQWGQEELDKVMGET